MNNSTAPLPSQRVHDRMHEIHRPGWRREMGCSRRSLERRDKEEREEEEGEGGYEEVINKDLERGIPCADSFN